MTREITTRELPAELEPVVEYFRAAKLSQGTRIAYTSALRSWATWCASFSPALNPWPPKITLVEGYLADLAHRGYKLSTMTLALAALGEATRLAGDGAWRRLMRNYLEDKGTLVGIRNTVGVAAERKARPLLTAELAECLRALSRSTPKGILERSLLLLGWSCALRASDLHWLELRDVRAYDSGYVIRIRRSKADQQGEGAELKLACVTLEGVCGACALRAWLAVRGDLPGPLYGVSRSYVTRAVKRAARRLGLDPVEFSSHSLRAGAITSWDAAHVAENAIGRVSRHASTKELRKYIRGAQLLREQTPAELTLERYAAETGGK